MRDFTVQTERLSQLLEITNRVRETLGDLELVFIMTVNPGFGGQDFIPSSIDQVARVVKAGELSGSDGLLFIRNSTTGAVEARPRAGRQSIELNAALHAN